MLGLSVQGQKNVKKLRTAGKVSLKLKNDRKKLSHRKF